MHGPFCLLFESLITVNISMMQITMQNWKAVVAAVTWVIALIGLVVLLKSTDLVMSSNYKDDTLVVPIVSPLPTQLAPAPSPLHTVTTERAASESTVSIISDILNAPSTSDDTSELAANDVDVWNNVDGACEVTAANNSGLFVATGGVAHTHWSSDIDERPTSNAQNGAELLLMTHSRLIWFNTQSRVLRVLIERKDWRFRGVFGTDNRTLVTLATPDMREESMFLEMTLTGTEIRQVV